MDFTKQAIQDRIVEQAVAISKCGLYDGIFFDFWSEEWPVLGGWDGTRVYFPHPLEVELEARLNIVRRIRARTRPNFLIMGNVNDRIFPQTAPFVNGGFMEVGTAEGRSMLKLERPLTWFENNLREPRINALEGWTVPDEPPDSPENLRWMRAFTTLSLTHSDGYVLFEPAAPGWEERGHYWYDFWDADLGRPVGEKAQLYDEDIQHLYIREFTNGWVVYNQSGSEQAIILPELAVGVESGVKETQHTLPDRDGEIYLRAKPKNPADVNGDGVVNIFDLTIVAQGFGTDSLKADVNGDGVVNVFDLVFVANQFQPD